LGWMTAANWKYSRLKKLSKRLDIPSSNTCTLPAIERQALVAFLVTM
jgi:hypothetical protein